MSSPESVPDNAPVQAGEIIDEKYRVDRILGAGGMGVVVVATHLELDQQVAIKFLLPAVAKNAEAVARFAREARAAAKIQSEHVTRVIDVAKLPNGAPYIVMEYLEGEDLEHALEKQGSLPIERVVDYLLQALEALAEAHVAGIVHRDLKPANLFLARRADGSSVVKVLDFGISKLVRGKDPQITTTSVQIGSPLYMSPEQLRSSKDVDARSDIWAVGIILHELITGDAPFVGDTLPEIITSILMEPPLSMRLRRPDVPAELEAVVRRCLEKLPEARFASVGELAVALTPFGPERSRMSIERIVRVVAGRKETSLSPGADRRTPVVPASLQTPPTDPSWQTSGVLRSARNGRRVALAAVAGLLVVGAVTAGIVIAHQPASAPPPLPAVSDTARAATAEPPASATPAAPSTAAAAMPPSATPTVTPPPAGPRGVAPRASAGPIGIPAPTQAATIAPTVAPTKPGTADFGGRK
jgi:serine/threonine-protein kinase